ncbi:MAG: DUF3617 domain-containing protein [Rhizobacter sp.]|nr:DUF3617 domain-containing protein [Rhizobacter sp.]
MMKSKTTLTALLCAGTVLAAQAQTSPSPRIEAGLWEINMSIKSQTGKAEMAMRQAQAYIASLPPAQRKQVEEVMAQQGVKLGDKTSTVNACISKEDAERGTIPQQAGDCTQDVLEKTASSMKVKFSCTTNPPASGEAVVDFQSPTAYTSRGIVDTVVLGQSERVSVEQTGRWLGAECGSVRPLGK